MAKSNETPLMKQYKDIKQKYPETVLLFRLGDFFETFENDALITAKVCGITLTKRNNGGAEKIPLAGFPHHQLDGYLPKLVKAGYRVAVCEQLEDPKQAKGIVKRGVVEVVTPGVAMYDKLLDERKNNYLASVYFRTEKSGFISAGVAALDISTGEFKLSEVSLRNLREILEIYSPSEVIISKKQKDQAQEELEKLNFEFAITKLEDWIFDEIFAIDLLKNHFKTQSLKGFGVEKFTNGISAAGAILHYAEETQSGKTKHIKSMSAHNATEYMSLDYPTRKNLEIQLGSNNTKEGSLFITIDRTETPMGSRLLKKWISIPLKNLEPIQMRLDAVSEFYDDNEKRNYIRQILSQSGDLERLISKISSGRANPRDVNFLKLSLSKIPDIKKILSQFSSEKIRNINNSLLELEVVVDMINDSIREEPLTQLGGGGVFKKGFSSELDEFVSAKTSGNDWIKKYQESERQKRGIPSLKVGFNNVFGYYIDVTRTHSSKVPEHYNRKQTLTNSERYITPELKELEEKLLKAEEKINELEVKFFNELKDSISQYTNEIQQNAALIAELDVLQSYATISKENNYTKPIIDESEILELEEARHPVVEKILPIGESFTANSTHLDTNDQQIHIITGPNMSGKSVYLRQIALCTLMAQIGCYVPAKSARIGLVDRIFTRVGAQDNMLAGESTFLVEMQESANIMNNATSKSLLLLDEVGRGTATFDGISIAWSIAEYIHDFIGARTLFATHYHELNELAERYKRVHNFKVEVKEIGNNIIFTHKVIPGGSDHSFGIHVAKMAGMPYDVIERAKEIMRTLEENSPGSDIALNKIDVESIKDKKKKRDDNQLAIFEFRDDAIRERLLELKVENMTPIQSFQILAQLIEDAKNSQNDSSKELHLRNFRK